MSAVLADENPINRKLWHIAGNGDLEQLEKLLNQGAQVNAGDRTGVTALMRAVYHGQLTMVRALVEHGADPNAKDRSGLSALTMAKHAGHMEIVDTLLSFGAEVKSKASKPRPVKSLPVAGISAVTSHEATTTEPPEAAISQSQPAEINQSQQATITQTPEAKISQSQQATISQPPEATPSQSPQAPPSEVIPGQTRETSPSQATEVKTLHEPPDIWDLVHTTQPEAASPPISARRFAPGKFVPGKLSPAKLSERFVPGRFALRRVVSMRTLALACGAVIVCAAVAFGLLALRSTGNGLEEPEQRAEAAELESDPSANQRPSNAKATRDSRRTPRAIDLTKIKSVGRLGEPTRQPAPPVLAATALSAKKPSANPRTVATASLNRHNRNVRNTTRTESDQVANTKSAKKEQTPPVSDPIKPTVTQKPKVIQWP